MNINLRAGDVDGPSVTSGDSGNYSLAAPGLGSYEVVGEKDGFRDSEYLIEIDLDYLEEEYYPFSLIAGYGGLVPPACTMSYVLKCVNQWLFPPSQECAGSMSTVSCAVNSWLYPYGRGGKEGGPVRTDVSVFRWVQPAQVRPG